ncbi:hypothetical protein SAMD00019534_088440, partial [Acytostelium subglobosum LB1]|uniref:hypothetical protein n=1 Tax=Acytostelium subglobosum LB1 TaxID=1410327 RepID=UPI000644B719
ILDLDQRCNLNHEALDLLEEKNTNSSSSSSVGKGNKRWIYTGDIFVQMNEDQCRKTLSHENNHIENELQTEQQYLKAKEDHLNKLLRDVNKEKDLYFQQQQQQ